MEPVGGPGGRDVAAAVFGERFETVCRYVDILGDRGVAWGLVGPREAERLWERHILNSVAISGLIGQGLSVIDVGSGAGLPGIPLAILRPDLNVVLLEPLLRRYEFLVDVVTELGLDEQMGVWRGRAEDQDEVFDVVTCRAVAPLEKLLRWCTPLFYPDGQLLALKGESAAEELLENRALLARSNLVGDVVTVRAHADTEPTYVIRIQSD